MKVSFLHKLLIVFLGGILGLFTIQFIADKHLPEAIPRNPFFICSFLWLGFSVAYVLYWQFRDSKQLSRNENILGFWHGVVVYCTAFIMFRFGIMKLLGLHMNTSLVYNDIPSGGLTGYELMDYFFGRSPLFKIIIGTLQLFGAALLLFSRTRLLGVFVLLPILVNVALMDILFHIGTQVTILAILLIIGLCYLSYQDREILIAFFLKSKSKIQSFSFKKIGYKQLIRLSAILLPFLMLLPVYHPAKNGAIMGKYNVFTKDSLTNIYFDENDDCVFRYHNDYQNIRVGKAIYDENKQLLKVIWRYPKNYNDTLQIFFPVMPRQKNTVLTGMLGPDKFNITVRKVNLPYNR